MGANRSVDVEVVDRCVGCAANDLDLSTTMFDSLADHALGRVVGSWAVSLGRSVLRISMLIGYSGCNKRRRNRNSIC